MSEPGHESLLQRAAEARAGGRTVVAVQGLGFVGAAMAGVVAAARDTRGNPAYFVIGVDLSAAQHRIDEINSGRSPIATDDPDLEAYVARGVLETKNLVATSDERAYAMADTVVVDVNYDVGGLEAFRAAIAAVARQMRQDALLLVETTVPPGTTREVVLPLLREEFRRRGLGGEPLLAHSYERVTPGRNYIASIERFWRSYAAESEEAARRAEAFLATIIRTREYPLCRLESTAASELAKVMENSYRAVNIAFIHEWTRAAEDMGVNLFRVVESIAVRKGTHDNIRKPGFGVGGYCLTKDSYLAQWGIAHHFGSAVELSMTLEAMAINERMPAHTFDLLRAALGELRGRAVLVAGISYLNDVADTRNSPTAMLCDLIESAGAVAMVHDPYVASWPERPRTPMVGMAEGVGRSDAVVLAVRHRAFLDLEPAALAGPAVRCVVDTQDIVSDEKAAVLHARGIRPVGVGKGHWKVRFRETAAR